MIVTHGPWSGPDAWFLGLCVLSGASIPAGAALFVLVSAEAAIAAWALGAAAFVFITACLLQHG